MRSFKNIEIRGGNAVLKIIIDLPAGTGNQRTSLMSATALE
jgi:hypothetical protein